MGFIKRPESVKPIKPVKLEDADIPVERNIVCVVEESDDGNTVEIICVPEELLEETPVEEVKAELKPEPKPKAVISSTVTGEQFGNWIPSLRSTGSMEVEIKNAFYTKTGQLVTCTFDIVVTSMLGSRNDSPILLFGLPLNSINSSGMSGSTYISYFKTPTDELRLITGTIKGSTNQVELWCERQGRKGLFPLTQNDINVGTVLVGTVTYITI